MFISRSLETKLQIRFGHLDDYDDAPGQILFMMILDICNASADKDIESATKLLRDLSLASYAGESIEEFATEAQRLIHIMVGGYALHYNTGSDLLMKVTKTESDYFNRTMINLLDKVRDMEDKVVASRDPRTLTLDSDYGTHGPIALCGKLQDEYSKLLKRPNGWPALSKNCPRPIMLPLKKLRPTGTPIQEIVDVIFVEIPITWRLNVLRKIRIEMAKDLVLLLNKSRTHLVIINLHL